jgi:hypothetical protein
LLAGQPVSEGARWDATPTRVMPFASSGGLISSGLDKAPMSIIQATNRPSAAFLKGLRDNGKECRCHTCRLFEWHDDASRLTPFFPDVLCEERLSASRAGLTVVDSSETILRSAETTPDSTCLVEGCAGECRDCRHLPVP